MVCDAADADRDAPIRAAQADAEGAVASASQVADGSATYSHPDSFSMSTRGPSVVLSRIAAIRMRKQVDRVSGAEDRGDVGHQQRRVGDVEIAAADGDGLARGARQPRAVAVDPRSW